MVTGHGSNTFGGGYAANGALSGWRRPEVSGGRAGLVLTLNHAGFRVVSGPSPVLYLRY
jgi:hypothetical protein